ncbi:MAG: SIMPL domain-containing protein [Coriobacteriales bacterium]|nr:SIMPL domain-containing protein [Coriobacteriales bacterium]
MSQSTTQAISRRSFAGLAAAAALSLGAIVTPALASDDEERRFSVDASYSLQTIPDVADVSMRVEVIEETADKAQTSVALIVDDATAAIVDATGIDAERVNVSNMNIWPSYTYKKNILGTGSTPVITGYNASVNMSVKGIGVDKIGDIIAAATKCGVNRITGVTYTCSNYDEIYDQALTEACKRAAHKAEVAAAALNYQIVGVQDVNINYERSTYRVTNSYDDYDIYEEAESAAADSYTPSISFNPSAVEISASVDIDFLAKHL